jgi:hypothetical protein
MVGAMVLVYMASSAADHQGKDPGLLFLLWWLIFLLFWLVSAAALSFTVSHLCKHRVKISCCWMTLPMLGIALGLCFAYPTRENTMLQATLVWALIVGWMFSATVFAVCGKDPQAVKRACWCMLLPALGSMAGIYVLEFSSITNGGRDRGPRGSRDVMLGKFDPVFLVYAYIIMVTSLVVAACISPCCARKTNANTDLIDDIAAPLNPNSIPQLPNDVAVSLGSNQVIVTLPAWATVGSTLVVVAPSGQQLQFMVPAGAAPGGTLVVNVPLPPTQQYAAAGTSDLPVYEGDQMQSV